MRGRMRWMCTMVEVVLSSRTIAQAGAIIYMVLSVVAVILGWSAHSVFYLLLWAMLFAVLEVGAAVDELKDKKGWHG